MSAFAFFDLSSMTSAANSRGGAAPPSPCVAARHSGAACPASDNLPACGVCARTLSGRCSYCTCPGAPVCESCCAACDGCGRWACPECRAARLAACRACGYCACDECGAQPGDDEADDCKDSGPRGCWCDSDRKRDVGNRRYISRERYKVQLMTHPSMRASSLAACGLQDDDYDCDGYDDVMGASDLGRYDDDGGGEEEDVRGGRADDDAAQGAGDPWASEAVQGGRRYEAGAGDAARDSAGADAGAAGLSARRGSLDLASSDGGSSIRRSLMRYGSLESRQRHVVY